MAYKVIRVNVTRVLNTKAAKKQKRNGRDVIVVPSATMPDDIIMNRVKYPAAEIKASFHTLEKTPAPLNHPIVDGKFVSARDPEALNVGWIGAWNENVRYENGRIKLDKIIDVDKANQSEEGKRVLKAIEKGEPVHTSTGLLAHMEKVENQEDHDSVAHDLEFDHDAILLDFTGAATPDQGVGIFVNAQGATEEVEVINSIWDDADREMDWAVESIARALEKKAKIPIYERIKAAITEAFTGLGAETTATNEEAEMSKEEIDKLSAKVDALTESMKGIGDTITNGVATAFTTALKPLVDAQAAVLANEKAKEDAEKSGLIDKVVKANLLDETAAKETPLSTLKALAANIKEAKTPAPIRQGAFATNGGVVSAFKAPVAKKEA
ncbi:MAG TPA: hypothetical protein VF944_04380 [Candidatus Bathyarchaeia archaeon]